MVRPHYQQKKSHLAANTEIEVFFYFGLKGFVIIVFKKLFLLFLSKCRKYIFVSLINFITKC